ncbi:hypothetical protein TrLO_g6810 [Triparma laevis f. longispina]|uniref:Histone-lysine N-methyltransferase, H3 lysine-79 specific n=1 Tax=Triparma laevis f. longispina TaxID=1714387 RepID=A0A9W7FBZ7_9STRA|nr:hypothetical protein TrLO_g6810 [Triparma laevis f. longispina]
MLGGVGKELSAQAKVLVVLDFLSRDGIISRNAQSLLKELVLVNDPNMMSILPMIEGPESNSEKGFISKLYQLADRKASEEFDRLFEDCSIEVAKSASKGERADKELTKERSLIYGEVEFDSFAVVLRKICSGFSKDMAPMDRNKVFYDIGSGSGRAVMIARMTQDFKTCVGIELMENLAALADNIKEKYVAGNYSEKLYETVGKDVEFHQADFLKFDWSDGDLVFANSTCFTDELMAAIAERSKGMKAGSYLVTFTKGIISDAFELVEKKRYVMSWGPATVFIHRRLGRNGESVGPSDLKDWTDEGEKEVGAGKGGGGGGVPAADLGLAVTGRKMQIHEAVVEEDEDEDDYEDEYSSGESEEESEDEDADEEDDTGSGFYSESQASNYVITPATSVNSSFECADSSAPNTPMSHASSVSSGRPPRVETGSPGLRVQNPSNFPLSPGMRRVHAEESLGGITSPKDTMLMQRKRMRGKKMAKAARSGERSKLFN